MAEDDAPFRAEYAKSSRAGCKLCKGNITKDSLRVAKMVQSPFFDGKQPNWFHFSCFFKQCQPRSTGEVSGFPGLRPPDQDLLRARIQGVDVPDGGEAGSGGKDGVKGRTRKTTRSDLQVEYAKSSRSSCKGCQSSIEKGELRVAKMEQADPSERKGYAGLVPNWHHVSCFLERREEVGAEGVGADELSGFSRLKEEDQQLLKGQFKGPKKKAGKKRKELEKAPLPKRNKQEEKKERQLREQGEEVWRVRDQLNAVLSSAGLRQLLEANKQYVPSGESKLLDCCADGMVFGALEPCPECGGQLRVRSYNYQCTGNLSSWTKCTHSTTNPDRKSWVIPEDIMEEADFLKSYKFKSRKRLFVEPEEPIPLASSSSSSEPAAKKAKVGRVDAPLEGFTVFVIGRLSKTKPKLTQQVEEMGGKVVSNVSANTTVCLSNASEVDKMSKKMAKVEEVEVPVVTEEFLEDASKGGALLKIPSHTISSWGAPRHSLAAPEDETDAPMAFKSSGSQKLKLTVKGSSAVDPESGLEDSHHVLEVGKVVYNAVLGLVDIVRGTNSYYKLQVLEGDGTRSYYVFRSWGRVGTTIGGNKLEHHGASKNSAVQSFTALFLDKTGNRWEDRGQFKKEPNKFYPLEIDYGAEESAAKVVAMREVGSSSKLHPSVQDLVRMIFDVESMKKAMMEFEIDTKKMPLGKLSKRQIMSAYSVLTELQQLVGVDGSHARILDASNRFYTLIPHDFGLKKPPLLATEDVITAKTQMLDNLLDIEVAYSLLTDEKKGDPIDVNYEKLKTDIEVLPKDSEEYQILLEYVDNTHGATHSSYSLEVLDIFCIVCRGEKKRYKPFSKLTNRMLLWHGSRTTNYAGIFSQGLRIAPPEAPVTGYMFGKGIYFADMVSKSANYCRTSPSDPIGLMLLCEVALGNMYELTGAEYITKLPPGKHSTKGLGRTAPSAADHKTTADGVIIPKGKGQPSSATATSLLYNEYIVYDVAQVSMQYLLKVNFKYKW